MNAWNVFLGEVAAEAFDLVGNPFGPIRTWPRHGQPLGRARPVLWKPPAAASRNWETRVWKFDDRFGVELGLFGDWYAFSLTAIDSNEVIRDLSEWTHQGGDHMVCIAETMRTFSEAVAARGS